MASEPPVLNPGTGTYRPPETDRDAPHDHMQGWNMAIQNALANIGRAPGYYDVKLVLSATVKIENPGKVIEYVAKLI
jgi:hypothetical protein